jgi:glucans biosynthesis protein
MSNNPMQINEENRCLARTRRGKSTFCQARKVTGKKRCRMHGGTGDGAPKGNKNAFKHGKYSREAIEKRKSATKLKREFMELLRQMKKFDN